METAPHSTAQLTLLRDVFLPPSSLQKLEILLKRKRKILAQVSVAMGELSGEIAGF